MTAPLPTPVQAPSSGLPGRGAFELSGGVLCLDFVNTWGDRNRPEGDQLRSFDDLLAFSAQTGGLDDARRARLAQGSTGESAAEAAALGEAVSFRESLYRIFAAQARGQEFPPHDLARLNTFLRDAMAHLRIEAREGEGFGWAFAESLAPTAPLWPIARSAAELLVSADRARVTQCDGARCTWLFLDQSRTRTRRWCSMESCGNRAKAKRHYHRRREA